MYKLPSIFNKLKSLTIVALLFVKNSAIAISVHSSDYADSDYLHGHASNFEIFILIAIVAVIAYKYGKSGQ